MAAKKIAQAPIERVDRQPVVFQNQDSRLWLAGIVYRPRQRKADEKLPLIIIGGPMASVKDDPRMKAVVSIVPFTIMDIVVTATDEQLLQMKADYENGAEPERLHMIEEGSEGALYYFDPNRGAAVQMVEMPTWSQLTWHQFHSTEIIRDFRKPYLVITGEQAFTRPGAELMYQNAASEVKELHVIPGALHFEMYDHEEYVMQNLALIEKFLKENL